MEYLITFLGGFITFISPCLLPMLPVYFSYLGGQTGGKPGTLLKNSLGFILGFTIVFTFLGLLSGGLAQMLIAYKKVFQIAGGLLMIAMGLVFLDVIKINFLKGMGNSKFKIAGFFSSLVFGIVFAVAWTPCVGASLGAAIALAANSETAIKGVILLLTFSAGLGIPFLISAMLFEQLTKVFTFIKKHYKKINLISGIILIFTGILLMFGYLV